MEYEGATMAGGTFSIDINDSIVFKTLFNAGLSPQEAEVWIGRELIGATNDELSYVFQISEPVANHARTKTNYLAITKESMLALKKEKARLDKIKTKEKCRA
jgi:hypothetical protein